MVDWTHIVVAAISGLLTGVTTIAVLRNDVKWIRYTLERHVAEDDARFSELRRLANSRPAA